MMRQVQMSEPAAFSVTVCCSVHQHLQCAYIIQLNLHKRIVKCIILIVFLSASQMLILNPSRCKREGTG